MTVTAKCLLQAKYAEDADTTQIAAPPSTRIIIDKMTVTNVTGSSAQITVNVVAGGGAVDTSNVVLKTLAVAAGDSVSLPQIAGQVLNPGDFISTLASTASALVIRASGREVT